MTDKFRHDQAVRRANWLTLSALALVALAMYAVMFVKP